MNFDEFKKALEDNGQEHILKSYERLEESAKAKLIEQVEKIDFVKMRELYESTKKAPEVSESIIEPIAYIDSNKLSEEEKADYIRIGETAIQENKLAVVTMAGGQGTRLGHSGPKGTFDIGIPSHKSIFEIQCDILKEANEKYGVTIPWYIMTSNENHQDTIDFFEANDYFGYPRTEIGYFFSQNELPMIDEDGKLILNEEGLIKLAADGHGGVFEALVTGGILEDMKKRGAQWLFIAAIDNVLVKMADPLFIGFAIKKEYKIASKTIPKTGPEERVGVFCKKDGKPYVIEYTEISPEFANMRDENGELLYGEGHVLLNLFHISALEEIEKFKLPYHAAHKKCSYMNEEGVVIAPEKPNAYKFETFLFDAFAKMPEIGLLRGKREIDFSPVKNAEGVDSPETARRDYMRYHGIEER
ncbi:MAG: UDPGP type 1 family protein [Clostridia bacterium]|nr:UDPGP type 1 family protein [Clostridia bacterium]